MSRSVVAMDAVILDDQIDSIDRTGLSFQKFQLGVGGDIHTDSLMHSLTHSLTHARMHSLTH